jgi:hypothetical protein
MAPWRECLFHNVFMFNLSGNEAICWSKNESQKSNNTRFWQYWGWMWGTPKKDLWKLAAAISLLNLTSWSLADLAEKIGLQA